MFGTTEQMFSGEPFLLTKINAEENKNFPNLTIGQYEFSSSSGGSWTGSEKALSLMRCILLE